MDLWLKLQRNMKRERKRVVKQSIDEQQQEINDRQT